ncbi:cation diffusion facilitator family transporter [Lactobacillus xylocopicola]|uniref:Cobalt transporter n=1 Tax=Lactobacillus xylocopicola TaxID=2976676 RepID=A0ABM8BHT0_9LACO|nr:cation diffusion facilitator family transporter [Lactobacillus xylocopicola]BDR60852.1 cobalt transporter [Lactobacillus xylocopicola]
MKDHTTRRYAFVTALNVLITVAEFIGGFVSGSLSLLSDAVHNLSDVGAIIISFVAHLISNRRSNQKKTFGYDRAETLAAFTNGVILILISVALFIEALERFWEPTEISGGIMLVVSVIGLLANLLSMLVMHQAGSDNLNVRSTFIHMLSDALSSVAVVIGAIFIYFWHITWIDPVMTMLVSVFVFREACILTGKAADVLMESNPDIDLDQVNQLVLSYSEIKNIHHVHVWRYSDRYVMLDAHVNVNADLTAGEFEALTQAIAQKLERFGINHINFQVECERGKNDQMITSERSQE